MTWFARVQIVLALALLFSVASVRDSLWFHSNTSSTHSDAYSLRQPAHRILNQATLSFDKCDPYLPRPDISHCYVFEVEELETNARCFFELGVARASSGRSSGPLCNSSSKLLEDVFSELSQDTLLRFKKAYEVAVDDELFWPQKADRYVTSLGGKVPDEWIYSLRAQIERVKRGPSINLNFKDIVITKFVHQGAVVHEGTTSQIVLNGRAFHREFTFEVQGAERDHVVFVRHGTFCGIETFTQPGLTCSASASSPATLVSASRLDSTRAFGLEFEFVAHEHPTGTMPVRELLSETKSFVEAYVDMFTLPGWNPTRFAKWSAAVAARFHNMRLNAFLGELARDFADLPHSLIRSRLNHLYLKDIKDCAEQVARSVNDDALLELQRWAWTSDGSVKPLSLAEVDAIGAGAVESTGVGFELVSPILHSDAGMHSVQQVLALLRHMGIQAGPSSGLHVHVNAIQGVGGVPLSIRGIASVWVAWAQFQLVIDEFLSPARPGSDTAGRLFLGECPPQDFGKGDCRSNPCECARRFFKNLHTLVALRKKKGKLDEPIASVHGKGMCNAIHSMGGLDGFPCEAEYPHQRYFQLNLVALSQHGSLEFRAHSATYDSQRVAHWVAFVVAFVDHFGSNRPEVMDRFFDQSAEEDLAELAKMQKFASAQELFKHLGDLVGEDLKTFYRSRAWEAQDALCKPPRVDV